MALSSCSLEPFWDPQAMVAAAAVCKKQEAFYVVALPAENGVRR
ncbi:L3 23 kDa protein [Human adenovirus 55]|uniref:23 kDa protein n=1 Tax=Human adenovirus 55 TaxID=714978 RepID=A0A075FDY2_9ADEN|nr:23 kDa protein [Human adenovirus 55]AMB61060.1 L3 23 kDa protein [Human adenovirus 55]